MLYYLYEVLLTLAGAVFTVLFHFSFRKIISLGFISFANTSSTSGNGDYVFLADFSHSQNRRYNIKASEHMKKGNATGLRLPSMNDKL